MTGRKSDAAVPGEQPKFDATTRCATCGRLFAPTALRTVGGQLRCHGCAPPAADQAGEQRIDRSSGVWGPPAV